VIFGDIRDILEYLRSLPIKTQISAKYQQNISENISGNISEISAKYPRNIHEISYGMSPEYHPGFHKMTAGIAQKCII
jgi:hypothetical protein